MEDEKINKAMVQEAVAKHHGVDIGDVEVVNFLIDTGSKVGDNFVCDIKSLVVEAKVKGEQKNLQYVAKCMPANQARTVVLKEWGLFAREFQAYSNLVPKLQKLRKDLNMEPLHVAECYYASNDNGTIIMENLKTAGFVMIKDKEGGMTLEEIKLLLKEMAAMHASTYHLTASHAGGMEGYLNENPTFRPFNMPNEVLLNIFRETQKKILAICVSVVRAFEGDELADKLQAFEAKRDETWESLLYGTPGSFHLLLHGDPWYNNMLLRYADDGSVKNHVLLDLQGVRKASPAIDVTYALLTSITGQLRENNLAQLIQYYYDHFVQDLKRFGHDASKIYTLDQLQKDYDDLFPYGFLWAIGHAQLFLKPEDNYETFEFGNMENQENADKMMADMNKVASKQAETNLPFRTRILDLAKEAAKRNMI